MITAIVDHQNNRILPARQAAEQVLAQYNGFSPAHRLLAPLFLADPPDNEKAYTHALKAREAYPTDSDVAKALGIASYRRNDHRRAVELLLETSRTKPNDPEVLHHLGLAQHQLKQFSEAKVTLEQALQLDAQAELAAAAKKALDDMK